MPNCMYRVLKSFEYLEPTTVEEVIEVLSLYGAKARVLAGGLALVQAMRRREIQPEYVVSLHRIPGLNYIEGDGTAGLRVGALTPLRAMERSPIINRDYLLLYEAVHQVASVQVKNMGTVVGNLCWGAPGSDVAPPLIVLGAELRIASLAPPKTIPLDSFFLGVRRTILQPNEIVTEILVPSLPPGSGSAFLKLSKVAADIAKVNVAAKLVVTNNTCKDVRIALGCVAPIPMRARKAEEILEGEKLEQKIIKEAAEAAAAEAQPRTSTRSTAEYRKEMIKVLVRRAVEKAWERAAA